jgi:hypothetical protein
MIYFIILFKITFFYNTEIFLIRKLFFCKQIFIFLSFILISQNNLFLSNLNKKKLNSHFLL